MKIVERQPVGAEVIVVQSGDNPRDNITALFLDGELRDAYAVERWSDGSEMHMTIPEHYKILIQDLYDAEKKA
jgi:hypothetical protein